MKQAYWEKSRAEILKRVGSMEQLALVRRVMLLDGRSKSVEAVEVDNGSGLSFTLLADRGLDMADARWCGQSLCWRSAAGVVGPAFYDQNGRGWLRGFGGGMLVTCGLRNVGPPSTDETGSFGQHGEISYSPAENVTVKTFWKGERYVLEIGGQIREAYPFGPNLHVERVWSTELGAKWVDLEDVVTNEGFYPELHMQLYHCNFGFPLINEKTRLEMSTDSVVPRDQVSARAVSHWNEFDLPSQDFEEQVYFHSYSAEAPESTVVRILPDCGDLGWGVELSYPSKLLPDLTQWKCSRPGEYVLGIEPGNCRPEGREAHQSRKAKAASTILAPGCHARFKMRLRILDNADDLHKLSRDL
jgi:hypothetical protein